eukprot:CAMPEP_0194539492 /NCGR_PEP_ID=MMETSP0253-20130528/79471_1 /TAXON_ID=2966 /ORGANISM="Noctiluca scintillans" /LENGTH=140 /DNA_ID=CAMNT_0039385775 /DNA_START=473 /DNA_END=895 /DNA_ORIENTATION=+
MSLASHPLALVASTIWPCARSLAMFSVVSELSAISSSVRPRHDGVAMKLSVPKLSMVLPPILILQDANAMLRVMFELPLVGVPLHPETADAVLHVSKTTTFVHALLVVRGAVLVFRFSGRGGLRRQCEVCLEPVRHEGHI